MRNYPYTLVLLSAISPDSWCQPQRSSQGRAGGQSRKLRFPNDSLPPAQRQSLSPPQADYPDYYYYYDDPLPSGPTRTPPALETDDYYYYDEDPLPAGPTREPPLPSGPTRKPGQPTTQPPGLKGPILHPALSKLPDLPFLTTARPKKVSGRNKKKKKNGLRLAGKAGLVPSNLDIVDQTKIFSARDPHQEQFIPPPSLNAGALPLAFHSSPSRNQFPPFLDR